MTVAAASAPTLARSLAQALVQAGHPEAQWMHVCAIPRRHSGWVLFGAGFMVEATTVRGQPAVYVVYQGVREATPAERTTQLQAYSASLADAGWTVQPIHLRPDRTRGAWPWERPDPASGVRALLVTPVGE